MALAVVNFLLTGGIKNLALHFNIVIENKLTVVLAGVLSAILTAIGVVYVQGQPLTLITILHWVFVFLGSLGIYQSIITGAKASGQAIADNTPIPPTPQAIASAIASRPKVVSSSSAINLDDVNVSAPH